MTNIHCPPRPLAGIVCGRFFVGEHDSHSAKHSHISALTSVSEASPVVIPASQGLNDLDPYINGLCRLLFPSAASNVDAQRYSKPSLTTSLVDQARDHIALRLMRMATSCGMPFLAICRGFQEMNVAFGGTLDSNAYASGDSDDHRELLEEDLVTRYRYKHEVTLAEDGILAKTRTYKKSASIRYTHRGSTFLRLG
jgi:putative glutamine amidotransferase